MRLVASYPARPLRERALQHTDPGRWRRRALSISGLLLGSAACFALLPLTLPLALLADLLVPRGFARSRTLLMACATGLCELWGVATLTWGWLRFGRDPDALARHAHRTQHRWTLALLGSLDRIFGLRYRVEGAEVLTPGPFLLLLNHASSADTLMPFAQVVTPHHYRARFVLKQELLWDPCIDLAGQRMKNHFARRGAGAQEAEAVGRLGADLEPDEVVVLYPEGTRFSASRRERRIHKLEEAGDAAMAARARALGHSLLPRAGGFLALSRRAPELDVVVGVHVGFAGVKGLASLLQGALVNREIRVRFQRYPAASLPQDAEARYAWLVARWEELDAWIASQGELSPPAPARRRSPE